MINKIKSMIIKYREVLIYGIIGVMTTLVNIASYFILTELIGLYYMTANIIAWAVAVAFAYVTNRTLVFRSKNKNILYEAWLFVLSRIFSLILETGLLYMFVDILFISDRIGKPVVAVVNIIANYVTMKLIVFRRRK